MEEPKDRHAGSGLNSVRRLGHSETWCTRDGHFEFFTATNGFKYRCLADGLSALTRQNLLLGINPFVNWKPIWTDQDKGFVLWV
ncbi:hypothetical protein KM043_001581 [Ampulex compressa]|nr:hypothetical protein KM043_001581 [Ampulex compressa]